MDAKNDDSAGSDSLDKSLQRKCVVDDVGQGEGTVAGAVVTQNTNDDNEKNEELDSATEPQPANSNKKQKTEESAGDYVGGEAGSDDGGSKSKHRSNEGLDSNINSSTETNKSKTKTAECDVTTIVAETLETVCNDTANSTNYTTNNISVTVISSASATANATNSTCIVGEAAPSGSDSSNSSNNTNAFETKVKQISKNLKETTLAETSANTKASLEDSNNTSSASSSSLSPEFERASINLTEDACFMQPSTSQAAAAAAAAAAATTATTTASTSAAQLESSLIAGENSDEQDHRSKKVRFHPDVKENDGGNRVIPKKKKKLKTSQAGSGGASGGSGNGDEATTGSQRGSGYEDEMELDEEEEVEEEGFDLAKTISEAQDYLKTHPLTFVRPYDKSSGAIQTGLLEEEDLPQLSELAEEEEEDFYGNVPPENGVERILGKQIKGGKVEFLLRYVERPGLFWESEEFLTIHCPNLLNQYEHCRQRRQEHLMSHVAKRQNLRQRYTDF